MSKLGIFLKQFKTRIMSGIPQALSDAFHSERDPCTREVQLISYDPPVRHIPR